MLLFAVFGNVYYLLEYFKNAVMDKLKVTHMSAGFDTQAVLVDDSSSSVLKYKTPQFRYARVFENALHFVID